MMIEWDFSRRIIGTVEMDSSNTPCVQCGEHIDVGLIFCPNCRAAHRPPTSLIQPDADDLKPSRMRPVRRLIVNFVKGAAGIAAVIAVFCPFGSWAQILTFMGSVVLLLICHFALVNLDDDYVAKYTGKGYWPSKATDWSSAQDRHDPDEERRTD